MLNAFGANPELLNQCVQWLAATLQQEKENARKRAAVTAKTPDRDDDRDEGQRSFSASALDLLNALNPKFVRVRAREVAAPDSATAPNPQEPKRVRRPQKKRSALSRY
jgi:hypothetical protein